MNIRSLCLYLLTTILLSACSLLKKQPSDTVNEKDQEITVSLDSLFSSMMPTERPVYNPSEKRVNDLLHVKLDIRFDWEKTHVIGKANLKIKPYYYPTDSLVLDAKGFIINEVSMVNGINKEPLNYTYDSVQISINLNKTYTRKDTFEIFIDYIARPNELPAGGSIAITEDKGLYFINPDGSDKDKPRQLWTQGETEANSAWYPVIDAPNEKITQEIFLTVDTQFVTLSNGSFEYAMFNKDGTRTDYWKQDIPHAPYLTMVAVGNWEVIQDSWRDSVPVNYYMEPQWKDDAKRIFGVTPEMMEFYSTLLGYDYPWDKYSQVIVRDFVSGAMENTSAVIHGEFVHTNKREYLDETFEDIVAHELFHHWFGDIVTCESWANLPLNESFATYGEYLWKEYKYGTDAADHHIQNDLKNYLAEARRKKVDMVRFGYEDREDMFDAHSYQKGGRILHMLRKYVGDPAFFDALNLYLNRYEYQTVEIHQLRLVFEEITGEDLNWFFNQWFLDSGHPKLEVSYAYFEDENVVNIRVEQLQDLSEAPLYKLPVRVDIYLNGKKESHLITVSEKSQGFDFSVSTKPDLVNFDADNALLAVIKDNKSKENLIFQYHNAPLYLDRYEAIDRLGWEFADSVAVLTLLEGLKDPYWNIRKLALNRLEDVKERFSAETKNAASELALKDPKPDVRAAAIRLLQKRFAPDETLTNIYEKASADSSYSVAAAAIRAIADADTVQALKIAKQFEREEDASILFAVSDIYMDYGEGDYNYFFSWALDKANGYEKAMFIQSYGDYLQNQSSTEIVQESTDILYKHIVDERQWFTRYYGLHVLQNLIILWEGEEQDIINQLDELPEKGEMTEKQEELNAELQITQATVKNLREKYDQLLDKETDNRIIRLLENSVEIR